ncbi:MAG: T9SS type A sorting domain-containing protein, partial [Bacteroidales bacterium]|nr:T9SS type A sorting domain-containing protein [Bacteroidales bacterium]
DREVLRRLVYAPVSWDMPEIHDFGHFNVFVNSDEPTAQVEGTEIILDIEQYNEYSIYVTTVVASGQESEHSETLTFNTDGINEITSSFTVYPNPASTDITVSSDITTGGAIKIVDMSGRIVKSLNSSDLSLVRISVDDLSRGVYLTVISYDNTVVVRKFIVK